MLSFLKSNNNLLARNISGMFRQDHVAVPAKDQLSRSLREARHSGFLRLPARQLESLPKQVYSLADFLEKDEKPWECIDLFKIDVSHNKITAIKDEIGNIITLSHFKMSQNALLGLPKGFFKLTQLVDLDLSHNQFSNCFPAEVGKLRNLRDLNLSHNNLTALPESIGNLSFLESLSIDNNRLSALPEAVGKCTRLHALSVQSNQLSCLPKSLRDLSALTSLHLCKNQLVSIERDAFLAFHRLIVLDLRQNRLVEMPYLPSTKNSNQVLDRVFLGYNRLTEIPESTFVTRDSITLLDLRDNQLEALPTAIATLYKLKSLDLSNNALTDLPHSLGYIKQLTRLHLDGNPMRAIRRAVIVAGCQTLKKHLRTREGPPPQVPEEYLECEEFDDNWHCVKDNKDSIGDTSTTELADETHYLYRESACTFKMDLRDKNLTRFPLEHEWSTFTTFCSTLQTLNLSNNQLTTLDSIFGELKALVTLIVEENVLQEIHPFVVSLPRLKNLLLRKNQLTSTALQKLLRNKENGSIVSPLEEIDVSNNMLDRFPYGFGAFGISLETLILSYNHLQTLADCPLEFSWAMLPRLGVLSLTDNKLNDLGKVFELPGLASFSFENNNVTHVPCELGLCPHLHALYLNGNPQKTIRSGIIAKGSHAVLEHLRNKLPQEPSRGKRSLATTQLAQAVINIGKTPNSGLALPQQADPADHERGSNQQSGATAEPSRKEITQGDNNAASECLQHIRAEINKLEEQLENHAISAPKQYALRKQLAMLRSKKLRKERSMKCI
uniref:Uncharacterized protein AlNc14C247G9584 n=1 Tax=Albugo laibachii Nc14 TaxID=890382 RepID=F0WT99_9STRA|nr:conserved hypothetical protein [Albugo laibachii Nc14]|eukprot:CCA24588.1 conserved hypothetical protein [Albugo laibachii Nc14]